MSPRLVALVVALSVQSFGCASSPAPQEQFSIEKPALMISGGPAPKYPPELLATGDTGTVIVRVTVSPEGRAVMSSAKVIASPHPAFSKAALAVIREYRFIPAEVGGTPMRCPPEGESRRCEPGRPGRKVAMPVDIPFVFRAPQPPPAVTPPPAQSDSFPVAINGHGCRPREGVETVWCMTAVTRQVCII